MSSAVPSSGRLTSSTIIAASCVLALLYFGRDVLQPPALAIIASLVVAPMIRGLGRMGLARLPAMLLSLAGIGACATGAGLLLASQLAGLAAELPHYHEAIRKKTGEVRALAERPLARLEAGFNALADAPARTGGPVAPAAQAVTAPQLPAGPSLSQLLAMAWRPAGAAGLVLVLLLFILLEQETLQDRLIRLAGQREISRTLGALADATRGVSRFFFSQFLVNAAFAICAGLALWMAGLPHAPLWGALSGVLRYVPYLGVLGAGMGIGLFAAAVDPGWSLGLTCLALFALLELLVAHVIEPKVYGHSTGLSPLAVVSSALFWGVIWGPVGLLVSTPLTVCLVVAGRYVRALEPLAILLGQAPSVTAAQRFYQRCLSGETGAILRDAGAFLRRAGFARYCDHILLPGLALAAADLQAGRIDALQQALIRRTVAELAEAMAPSAGAPAPRLRSRRTSLLDASIGAHLRKLREARLGRWQGPLDVPRHSIVLCAGLALERDELLGELLARALREAGIDARSLTLPLPHEEHDPARADLVSTVFLPYPLEGTVGAWLEAVSRLRALLPHALVLTIRHPADGLDSQHGAIAPHVDMVLRSFEEGLAFVSPARPLSG